MSSQLAETFVGLVGPWIRMETFQTLVADQANPLQGLDDWVAEIQPGLGFTTDKLRFLLCMFGSFPLAIIHRCLPDVPVLKHFYTAAIGMFMGWFSFREQILHTLFAAIVTYLVVAVAGKNKNTPVLMFFFNCGYLFTCHIHQQFSNWGGYQLDFTTVQMIFTIKLSQFAYNVYDGSQGDKGLKATQQWALKSVPNPLVFLAYLYYFPGLCAGPAFEISDYIRFTEWDATSYPTGRPALVSSFVAFFKKLCVLVIAFVGLTVADNFTTFMALCDPTDEEDAKLGSAACVAGGLSNRYSSWPIYQQIGFLMLASALCRWSYYFAWTLSDMASALSGLAYQKTKDSENWNRITNCRILDVEMGQSTRTCINGWNLGTTHWIRYYVYERLVLAGVSRATAPLLAFLVSAFWHGFYPGYYITFFCGHFCNETAKSLRTWLRPTYRLDKSNPKSATPAWYNAIGAVLSSLALNCIVWPFQLLDFQKSYVVMSSVYFVPYIIIAVVWWFAGAQAAKVKRAEKKAKAAKAQ